MKIKFDNKLFKSYFSNSTGVICDVVYDESSKTWEFVSSLSPGDFPVFDAVNYISKIISPGIYVYLRTINLNFGIPNLEWILTYQMQLQNFIREDINED